MIEFLTVFALAIVLGWPLGHYLAAVMRGTPDARRPAVRSGRAPAVPPARGEPRAGHGLEGLCRCLPALYNLVLAVLVMAVFMTQAWLPLNPDHAPNMLGPRAAHHGVLPHQHQPAALPGQAQLSWLAQMSAIVGLQVVTPMMGLALVAATLRGLFAAACRGLRRRGRRPCRCRQLFRRSIRPRCVLLPLCLLWSLLLTWQGVPSTLHGGPDAVPVDASAGMASQHIPLGPVAPMVAVKQLGTNGGGWYGPNSAVPLENPTPFS